MLLSAVITACLLYTSKKEIELLWTLAKNSTKVFSRDNLLDSIWGYDYFGDSRTVDSHISSSPGICIDPLSRSTTRPSPRYPQLSPRYPRHIPRYPRFSPRYPRHIPRYPRFSPRYPRHGPRYPRPPRARHWASRKSRTGPRLIEIGRPRTCNISVKESYPPTKSKLGG